MDPRVPYSFDPPSEEWEEEHLVWEDATDGKFASWPIIGERIFVPEKLSTLDDYVAPNNGAFTPHSNFGFTLGRYSEFLVAMPEYRAFDMAGVEASGECQGSCRLNRVMIPPLDEAAPLAAEMLGDANLRLVKSVPRCSLRRRSGARQPRHARARQGALRVAAGGSAPPVSFVARRGLGTARSGRESRLSDRTGKQDL
jgi:hypothetical protein